MNTVLPRVYVACLAAYNSGILHGKWIDVDSEDQMWSDINAMLALSPEPNSEEWAFHDYEGFGGLLVNEYDSVTAILEKAAFIGQYGELGAELVNYYGDMDSAKQALEDRYYGEFDSELDFSTDLFDELYGSEIPNHLQYYIDYAAFNRDIFINDYLSISLNGKVHVFFQE